MSHIIKKTLAKNDHAEVILAEYANGIHSCNVLVRTAFLDIKDAVLVRLNAVKHLNHPGILDIIDFGVCTNSKPKKHYISTRHIPGITLTQVLLKFDSIGRKIPHPLVMHVIMSLCNSLETIHDFYGSKKDRDILFHGSICPDNVYITFDGDVFFTDSGIADLLKYRFTGEKIVENGRTIYHHPDVLMGSRVRRHHEIYSMGILLFRMFIEENSFVKFFKGDGSRNLKHVKKFIPSIPAVMEQIIDRATRFRGLTKFAKYEQITDVYNDLLDYVITSSVKYDKTITSLILYSLFPESRDHSPVRHEIQLLNAIEFIKKCDDNSLRSFLAERFGIDTKTFAICDQYQILDVNVSADLSQKVRFTKQDQQTKQDEITNYIGAETVKIMSVPASAVQNLQIASVPVNHPAKDVAGGIEEKTNKTILQVETKKKKKYSIVDMESVKVALPQKTVQAFSKIIKDRSITDTQVTEQSSHSENVVHNRKNSVVTSERNTKMSSTLDSFAVLQQKNGFSNREKVLESFSNIIKKESVSV